MILEPPLRNRTAVRGWDLLQVSVQFVMPVVPVLLMVMAAPLELVPSVIRVKAPAGVKLMPHRHPEDRIYTVMSGVFYIGLGDR